MKKIIIILSVVLTTAYAASAQQLDSLTRGRLSDKLEEYFEATGIWEREGEASGGLCLASPPLPHTQSGAPGS